MDLIKREDAIKAVENVSENYTKEGDREWHPHIDFITQELVQVPSVSPITEKRGEWLFKEITDDYHVIGQCSVCKERRRIDNFCPNCGADMRKGADDE